MEPGAASRRRSTSPHRARATVAAVWLAAAPALALQHPPDGFGAVRFGSSVAQATAALPGLQRLGGATPGSATPAPIAYYRVADQAFADLRPCAVSLGFVADRFYEARLDCGRGPEVERALRRRFGAPTRADAQYLVWEDARVTVSLNRSAMNFALADRALSQAVHQLIVQQALSGRAPSGGAAPPP
jgi:hypothetical protein